MKSFIFDFKLFIFSFLLFSLFKPLLWTIRPFFFRFLQTPFLFNGLRRFTRSLWESSEQTWTSGAATGFQLQGPEFPWDALEFARKKYAHRHPPLKKGGGRLFLKITLWCTCDTIPNALSSLNFLSTYFDPFQTCFEVPQEGWHTPLPPPLNPPLLKPFT